MTPTPDSSPSRARYRGLETQAPCLDRQGARPRDGAVHTEVDEEEHPDQLRHDRVRRSLPGHLHTADLHGD